MVTILQNMQTQVNAKLAEAMKAAGCHQAYLGFESCSDGILKMIRKGATMAALEVPA